MTKKGSVDIVRKSFDELNKIKKQHGVNTLWSWSRLNTYLTDSYSYFLKYVLNIKEDRNNSIYGVAGGIAHSIIEAYYNGDIEQEDMIKKWQDEMFTVQLSDMKFDRNDSEKNKAIENKYMACMEHFFINHKKPNMNMALEMFILIKIADGILFQGYIDNTGVTNIDGKKHIIISDYKSSTIYTGDKLKKERGQLVLYAEGIRQKTNLPLDQIHIRYLFLKYVTVNCLQANGKWKERHIERNAIGESLVSSVKMWLKKEGFEDEMDNYIEDVILTNSLQGLPQSVQDKFVINDCYVEIPLGEEIIDELKNEIIDTVHEIDEKTKEYNETLDNSVFWQDVDDKNSYYMAILSGYSPKLHKPYAEYLDRRNGVNNQNIGSEDSDGDEEDRELLEFLSKL